MDKVTTFAHQGDLNFKRIDALPEGLVPAEYDKARGGYTLALGEHTNHAHTLIADPEETTVKVLRSMNGEQYLVVSREVELKHGTFIAPAKIDEKETDKHAAIVFTPGIYKVGNEQEYDPFAQQIKKVTD